MTSKLLPNQQAFLDAHPDRGTVYQTAVTYVNPQWIDIGKDLTAMFTGAMQPEDVLASIDKRRAQLATSCQRPSLDGRSPRHPLDECSFNVPNPRNAGWGRILIRRNNAMKLRKQYPFYFVLVALVLYIVFLVFPT